MRRLSSALIAALIFGTALPQGQSQDPRPPTEAVVSGGPGGHETLTLPETPETAEAPEAPEAPEADESASLWFLELASPPIVAGGAADALGAEEAAFHDLARQAGVAYRTARSFRDLWHGLTVETDGAGADRLRDLPGVRAVYPVLAAPRLGRAAGGSDDQPRDPDALKRALSLTGIDRLRDRGDESDAHGRRRRHKTPRLHLSGRHVKVAVMDSGIDFDHPDLGGCFGPGCRVAAGWDFVGDAFNPDRSSPRFNPTPVPDAVPDDCDGHGTHVAGIIGADGVIGGVAPEVTFHAYRVFGCEGPTTTDVMLAAMERAYADGADILNISIGAPYQWPDYPTAQAADRLVERGIIVVASAGNEGANGLYAAAAPGIGRRVISVASFDNASASVAAFAVTPDGRKVGYLPASGTVVVPTAGSAPLARTGDAAAASDACTPLPAGSLQGRVALIRRGTCSFITKAANAQAAGAVAAVMYNSAAGRIAVGVTGGVPITIPVVSIAGEDGELLDARLAQGPVTLTWTTGAVQEPLATANLISAFSSYGPTADLALKPDVGAPGGAIRSTLPLERGGWGSISGTSMAAPYVAGAIALLLEARPGTTADEARTRLQNTAVPHQLSGAASAVEHVHRQGAGMIAVDQAVRVRALVTPSRLELGELETDAVVRTLHLSGRGLRARVAGAGGAADRLDESDEWNAPGESNESDHSAGAVEEPDRRGRRRPWHRVTYSLGHEPAASTGPSTFAPAPVLAFATVTFSRATIRPGEDVDVRIGRPADPAARLFGGYITLKPDDDGPVLRVPYLGYSGDYQGIRALTPTPANFPWLARTIGSTLSRLPNGGTFTMQGSDVPIVLFHLEHQVRLLQVEIVDISTGQSYGAATTQEFVSRNSTATAFFSSTWTGSYTPRAGEPPRPVPNGAYRLSLTVLKANGDPQRPDHMERWDTPTIVVTRP